jgi:hypothetical protein
MTESLPISFDRRQLATLGAAMFGFFVVALDAQIVNVALADIGSSLGGGRGLPGRAGSGHTRWFH